MLVGSPGSQPWPARSRVSPTSVLRKSGIDTNVKSGSSPVGAIGTAGTPGPAATETGSMSPGVVTSHTASAQQRGQRGGQPDSGGQAEIPPVEAHAE